MGFNSGFKGLIYLNCMMMQGPANVRYCFILTLAFSGEATRQL